MLLLTVIALRLVTDTPPDNTAVYVTAASAIAVALVTALGGNYVRRSSQGTKENGVVARDVQANVGVTNGSGTLAQMVERIDKRTELVDARTAAMDTRTATMDSRLARHESFVSERMKEHHKVLTDLCTRMAVVETKLLETE